MLRHHVIITFSDDADETTRQAAVDRMQELSALPMVRGFALGKDVGISDRSSDVILSIDFDDADAWYEYQQHPEHQDFVNNMLMPILASRAAVQIEIAG